MTWSFDPYHSTVGFSVKHMGLSTVRGRFGALRVEDVAFDPSDVSSARGRVVIDVASVDTGDANRDTHLRSADFFDVEKHPTITFAVTGVEALGGDEYRVRGDLTILGVTRPVELAGEFSGVATDFRGKTRAGASLQGTVNRKDWGLSWGPVLEAGRLLVGDKVKLEIELQLELEDEAEVELAGAAEAEAESVAH